MGVGGGRNRYVRLGVYLPLAATGRSKLKSWSSMTQEKRVIGGYEAGIKAHFSAAPSPRAATPPPQSPNQLSAVASRALLALKKARGKGGSEEQARGPGFSAPCMPPAPREEGFGKVGTSAQSVGCELATGAVPGT